MNVKNAVQRLKTLTKVIFNKEFIIFPEVVCKTKKFGSSYGGWNIVTKNINSNSIVYSFGVGEDASFDLALINEFGLTVHAFDPTPKSIDWVKTQNFPDRFVMHEYGLAAIDGEVLFNPPQNPKHVSHTLLDRPATNVKAIPVHVKKLRTIMDALEHSQIDILKMDIEGAEYEVINDIVESKIRPKQLLVEFHHRFPGVGITTSKKAINKIRLIGYQLFSVSPSNQEFGFIRI